MRREVTQRARGQPDVEERNARTLRQLEEERRGRNCMAG
jgi:hypothetical protein